MSMEFSFYTTADLVPQFQESGGRTRLMVCVVMFVMICTSKPARTTDAIENRKYRMYRACDTVRLYINYSDRIQFREI